MIILGEKHTFSDLELKICERLFKAPLILPYKERDSTEIIKEIETFLQGSEVSLIVLNTKAEVPAKLIAYLTELELRGVRYMTVENFLEHYLHKCYIAEDHTDISYLENIRPYTPWQYTQKRVIDFLGVFFIFFFSWPIMIYSAYRIKKESPDGPVFFKQKRIGRNGKEFECIKFRSMYTDVDYFNHYTQENDPRIFPWGATMRKTRIDELPQMWNILKGEMHLIGPRAEWKDLVEKYEDEIPYYNERHLVAPGITGWAQVNYPYGANAEDAREKLMYDLYYIKHWNLWLEIKTALLTAKVMFLGLGR